MEGFITPIEDMGVKELFNKVKVIINGNWIGIADKPYELYVSLHKKKYKGIN